MSVLCVYMLCDCVRWCVHVWVCMRSERAHGVGVHVGMCKKSDSACGVAMHEMFKCLCVWGWCRVCMRSGCEVCTRSGYGVHTRSGCGVHKEWVGCA